MCSGCLSTGGTRFLSSSGGVCADSCKSLQSLMGKHDAREQSVTHTPKVGGKKVMGGGYGPAPVIKTVGSRLALIDTLPVMNPTPSSFADPASTVALARRMRVGIDIVQISRIAAS